MYCFYRKVVGSLSRDVADARRFIYSKTRDVCEELDSFGIHYSACLGEHDDCVDPKKETNSSAPSSLVVVGGFRTCGTQRIYDMLKSHPNIVTLSIQAGALPNLELEFEEVVFALAKALQLPTGRPLIQVCDEFQFKVPTFVECDRLVNKIKGSYNTSMPATLVVTDPSFFDKRVTCSQREAISSSELFITSPKAFERRPCQLLATRWPGKVKLLFVVREPADFLWAAYNTWTLASRALSFGIFFCELGLQGELERDSCLLCAAKGATRGAERQKPGWPHEHEPWTHTQRFGPHAGGPN